MIKGSRLLILLVLLLATVVFAQEGIQGAAQFYVYPGDVGELQIKVQIWGQVRMPGMYQVPKSMDVVGLMSLAGGPTEDANLSAVRIVRTALISDVLKVDIQGYTRSASIESIPILEAGDMVIVPENPYHKFERFVRVVAQIAIIAQVYNVLFGE